MFNSTLKFLTKYFGLAVLYVIVFFTACNKEETYLDLPISGPDQVFYAISNGATLVKYNAQNVKTVLSTVKISGLASNERILSIDFRPYTGELYALSNLSIIYILNIESGVSRPISTAFKPSLSSAVASMDFDPTTDKVRIITVTGQNLRLNPETGEVSSIDTPTPSNISAIAHDNNFAGSNSTTLFDLDLTAKKLFKQDAPNDGTVKAVGDIGADLGTNVSFDISPNDNKTALAVSTTAEGTRLYSIDLKTGTTTLNGKFNGGTSIASIAIPTNPAAYAVDGNSFLVFNPLGTVDPLKKTISGLQPNETVVGMDLSPFNGQLFALGSSSRLYSVNLATAVFTPIVTISPELSGTIFGTDFNPSLGYMTIISNTGQSLSVSTSGTVTTNTSLPNTASISAAAYNNNYSNAGSTTLYVIDYTTDKLYSMVTSTGVITEIGSLKVDATAVSGFDIISTNSTNTAYAILTVAGEQGIYSINLSTGLANLNRKIEGAFTAFTLGIRFN